jgi:CPA2 family monovalent cation:H+ antiporter-2
MHAPALILTIAAAFAAAAVMGYLTHRLRLSPIVGYLIAGLLVGPYTPGFVADRHLAEQLAEIGVILLMFGVGLQFHVEELLAVKRVAIPGAIGQSAVATLLGVGVALMAGWGQGAGLVFGIALSVASTVVLVRVLGDANQLHTPVGHIAVGWLVVEDLLTVLVLVLMPALAAGGGTPVAGLGWAALKVVALAAFTIAAGGRGIPWMLTRVAATRSRELFTLAVLATALGIAAASAALFGVSMALGAFLAGLVVGRSDFSVRAASDALPMRDAFAVLFFVSVGMLLDPAQLSSQAGLIGLTLAVIVVGKPLTALAIVALFRYPLRVSLPVAVSLAQVGEFSFMVMTLAGDLGLVPAEASQTVIAASIISITLNPLLFRILEPLERRITRRRDGRLTPEPEDAPAADHRAVVVGGGPIGRTVVRLLEENGIRPTVIDLNLETVRALQKEGVSAVYGDATRVATLSAAGVARARSVIVSVAGVGGVGEIVRAARESNPSIQILARVDYLRQAAALKASGADVVVSGEGEVALAFTAAILERLGATAEQIDRERARVHADLSV